LPASNLLDAVITLPEAANKSFWLDGSAWQFPDYENAETFVERLVREGTVENDRVVEAVMGHQPLTLSPRSIQRRFLQVTGLTHSAIRQIACARRAMARLQQGASILDTVFELGYTDQPHMTKSLKHFIGQTPAQLVRSSQLG
jgi:methylphosphotriester-DNA--protein-cysteine methyltransferase